MTSLRHDFSRRAPRPYYRCSEIAYRSQRCVATESRSDPTSSRCQISRLAHQTTRLERRRMTFSADESEFSAGGARRNRTDDLLLAKQALSQLSYGPSRYPGSEASIREEHARR